MSERQHKASKAIDSQHKVLAEAIVDRQYELQAELWKAHGTHGREKSVRDAGYHLTYLSEALTTSKPALFADYVAWVTVLFGSLGFPDDVLVTTLECTQDALRENLPADLSALTSEFISLGLDHLQQTSITLPIFLEPQGPPGRIGAAISRRAFARGEAPCQPTRPANCGAGHNRQGRVTPGVPAISVRDRPVVANKPALRGERTLHQRKASCRWYWNRRRISWVYRPR